MDYYMVVETDDDGCWWGEPVTFDTEREAKDYLEKKRKEAAGRPEETMIIKGRAVKTGGRQFELVGCQILSA